MWHFIDNELPDTIHMEMNSHVIVTANYIRQYIKLPLCFFLISQWLWKNCKMDHPEITVYTVLCRQDHTWGDFTDKGQTLGTVGGLPFTGGAVDTDTGPGTHAGLPCPPGCVDHRPHSVHPCVGAGALEKRIKAQLSIYALFKLLFYNKCFLLWFMPVWRQRIEERKYSIDVKIIITTQVLIFA